MTARAKRAPRALAGIGDVEVLAGLLSMAAEDVARLLPRCALELPTLLAEGVEITALHAAAERLACAADRGAFDRVQTLLLDLQVDELAYSALKHHHWALSEAGFGLGLVAGLRLGGGRR
ncbi:MAG: hypothetical protein AB7H93_16565 [Vicinamibacterales bacterium]